MTHSEGDVKRNFRRSIARTTVMLSQFRHRYESSLDPFDGSTTVPSDSRGTRSGSP